MSHATKATVDSVRHVPAALALRQRPSVSGARSTFGTSTELLNVLRLLFSRVAEHLCPNGHRQEPTIDVAAGLDLTCPVCGVTFTPPGAEALAFNSDGACPTCGGLGVVREIDDALLVPDPSRTIADGAVAPWKMMGLTVMPQMVGELGVRTDVPYRDLTDDEREVVLRGPRRSTASRCRPRAASCSRSTSPTATPGWPCRRRSTRPPARAASTGSTSSSTPGHARPATAPGSASGPWPSASPGSIWPRRPRRHSTSVIAWAPTVVDTLPVDMRAMATAIIGQLLEMAQRLVELGLGYLGLDRPSSTLSTGERQRVALSRAVRNQTTGVLYVLDEPSIGLHPSNIDGLNGVIRDLLRDGNSVVLVDHDVQVLREADWFIEIGPGSGSDGGTVLAEGTLERSGGQPGVADRRVPRRHRGRSACAPPSAAEQLFDHGRIRPGDPPAAHGARPGRRDPEGPTHRGDRSVRVRQDHAGAGEPGTGVAGHRGWRPAASAYRVGRTVGHPARQRRRRHPDRHQRALHRRHLQRHSRRLTPRVRRPRRVDPPGPDRLGLLLQHRIPALPALRGTGQISLDVQFLPDVDIPCPDCDGTRYAPAAQDIRRAAEGSPLPELLALTVKQALRSPRTWPKVHQEAADPLASGWAT